MQLRSTVDNGSTGMHVDVDAARLRRALAYLIRAMARRCKLPGVYVNTEVIITSPEQLHISVHLRGFYDPLSDDSATRLVERLTQYASTPPSILGWSERETRIITYLLRTVGITPMFGALPDGSVSVLLDATCAYTVEEKHAAAAMSSVCAANAISAVLVSDDPALSRLNARADLADYEVVFMLFERALAQHASLRNRAVLLIDVADIAAALKLMNLVRSEGAAPRLIAICPPGHLNDALENRLFELGFTALVQKPLQYSRVVQVIRTVLVDPLSSIQRNSHPIKGDGDSRK